MYIAFWPGPGTGRAIARSFTWLQIVVDVGVRLAMADSIHLVFVIAFVSAALGLVAVFFTPHQELKEKPSESEASVVSMD